MESLQVRTGQISLRILDDSGEERGIFKFNPQDISAAKKLMELQSELDIKNGEFQELANKCETPEEKVKLLEDEVNYIEGLIDDCFGIGSSLVLFGNAKTLSMFYDFFDGITPYYQKASKNRMDKYKKSKK